MARLSAPPTRQQTAQEQPIESLLEQLLQTPHLEKASKAMSQHGGPLAARQAERTPSPAAKSHSGLVRSYRPMQRAESRSEMNREPDKSMNKFALAAAGPVALAPKPGRQGLFESPENGKCSSTSASVTSDTCSTASLDSFEVPSHKTPPASSCLNDYEDNSMHRSYWPKYAVDGDNVIVRFSQESCLNGITVPVLSANKPSSDSPRGFRARVSRKVLPLPLPVNVAAVCNEGQANQAVPASQSLLKTELGDKAAPPPKRISTPSSRSSEDSNAEQVMIYRTLDPL